MLIKFSVTVVATLCLVVMVAAEEQPKYGGSFEPSNQDYLSSLTDDSNSNAAGGSYNNETNAADAVIDTILNSGREGRNLDGFDEVYSDPTVQQALQKGDDRQARNVIKDKLCSLGLMECESEAQGKRPFLPPGELIYSQPPPGYRPPNGAYGPARPMPPPQQQQQQQGNKYNGPPRKVGYASGSPFPVNGPSYQNRPPGPIYVESKPPGPFYEGSNPPGPIYQGSRPPQGGQIFEGPKPPGPIYDPSGSAPYKFDTAASTANYHHEQHEKFETVQDYPGSVGKPTIVVNAQGGGGNGGASAAASSVNIHHHYHHLDGADKGPAVIVKPGGVGYVSGNSLATAAEYSAVSGSGSLQTGGFNPSGFAGVNSGGLGSVNGLGSSSGSYASGGSYSSGASSGAYKPISEPGNNYVGASGYDGSVNSYGGAVNNGGAGSSFGGLSSGSLGQYGQSGSAASFNGQQQSFHSQNPNFYKKALNTNGGGANGLSSYSQANYNKYSSQSNGQQSNGQFGATGSAGQFGATGSGQQYNTGENYQGYDTARQDECTCVPYEQCPSQDVIGRKDDLILPLDPRHLKSDIEALEEDAIVANTTSETSARVTKDATEKKEEGQDDKKDEKKDEEVKKISKREAPVEGKAAKSEDKLDEDIGQADGEARFLNIGALGGGGGAIYGGGGAHGGILGGKKVVPTFGVSFGLPYPSHPYGGGGYPLNPLGNGAPAQNPYFGSLSPNGLNLGLVNVNPLVSFQIAKNEFGEKLFKPLVNLHVTPTENIVQKVGEIIKRKKFGFGGGGPSINQHYHTHTHYPNPPEVYYPHGPHGGPHGGQHYHESAHHFESHNYPSGPSNYPLSGPGGPPPSGPYPSGPSGGYGFPSGPQGGGGYGFPSGPPSHQGYYRDGSSNVNQDDGGTYSQPQSDYNYDSGRNYNNESTGNVNESPQYYNYQDLYPQNQQLQSNEPPRAYADYNSYNRNSKSINNVQDPQSQNSGQTVSFPSSRRKRSTTEESENNDDDKSISNSHSSTVGKRQAYYQQQQQRPQQQCSPRQVCCRRPQRPPAQIANAGQCGRRNTNGITGRIKNPVYIDGDSEFGEYPWQVAILKKDPKESVYICGGTLIDHLHILTAAHCVKTYTNFDLRVRLGEWDVNHDVEFFPYIERDVVSVTVHPEYYAGTLDNDLAIIRLNKPVDFANAPHISPACLPDKFSDFTGARCWTTGWGKDAFGDFGKYQNILKEVDVPIIGQQQCQQQLRNTRLGYGYKLNPGFICAGGEEGKDACKGDGGGPMVCERNGVWQLVGVVSWGIGCGQVNVPGVYVRVSHYLDWIQQNTQRY